MRVLPFLTDTFVARLVGSLLLFVLVADGRSAVLRVPADHPDVQSAIAAASDGDTVLVSPGTYVGAIDFLGRNILVLGEAGPAATILEGDPLDPAPVVTFRSGETSSATLQGFTVRGGRGGCIDLGGGFFDAFGGGILVMDGAGPTLTGNVIAQNSIERDCVNETRGGGGIAVLASASFTRIADNEIVDNRVVAVGEGILGTGGGIYYASPAGGEIVDNVIARNVVDVSPFNFDSGGGITLASGAGDGLVVDGNRIEDNSAESGSGGGIAGSGTLKRNTVRGNRAMFGGGIGAGAGVISLNVIVDNEASESGGGIHSDSSSPVIRLNTIADNVARSGGGIAILSHFGRPEVRRNRIVRNFASGRGGGIYTRYYDFEISNNFVIGNVARRGGGVAAIAQSQPDRTPGRFAYNTLHGNVAADEGGGLVVENDARFVVLGSILWNDSAPSDAAIYAGVDSDLRVEFSNVQGGWPGPGNLDVDPLFRDAANDDLHLRSDSACIDAIPSGYSNTIPNDFDGDLRPTDGGRAHGLHRPDGGDRSDIGADEWNPVASPSAPR